MKVGGFASVMQEQFAKIAEIAKTVWDSTPIQTFVEAKQKHWHIMEFCNNNVGRYKKTMPL